MAQKVLAARSGRDRVEPGEIVVTDVDLVVMGNTMFYQGSDHMPSAIRRVARPENVAIILDLEVPAPTIGAAESHMRAREMARQFGIERIVDIGNHGIKHQVILEQGFALPGHLVAVGDSHATMAGAVNCASRGLSVTDILQIVCTGKTWYRVSPSVKVHLTGSLPLGAYAKDLFLHIAGNYGSFEGHDIEFDGPGLASLPMDERATLATMCTELSVNFAMLPVDETVEAYLAGVTDKPYDAVVPDPDAEYAKEFTVDLCTLKPYVSMPDFIPNNTQLAALLAEEIPIDQAFIGSCANGQLADFEAAAEVLRGRHVAEGVRLIVTPASQRIYLEAVKLGYVATLVEAGAVVTNSTCGACCGGHMGVLGPGEVCITSSTRNFRGRMGSPDARIYMGSSATVAASAIAGHITDPLPFLDGTTADG